MLSRGDRTIFCCRGPTLVMECCSGPPDCCLTASPTPPLPALSASFVSFCQGFRRARCDRQAGPEFAIPGGDGVAVSVAVPTQRGAPGLPKTGSRRDDGSPPCLVDGC